MKRTVGRFVRGIGVVGFSVLGMVLVAVLVALRHIMETPQPLESYLPGLAQIYRWRRGHIFYKVDGDEGASPLVLLHAPGIGASSHEMRHLVEPLAQQFRVYAPDLPGFGLSDRPHMDYSAETYITLLESFLRDVVGQPATLLASGLSNNYAVAVAQCHPTLVERLVLISPSSLFQREQSPAIRSDLMRVPFLATLLYSLVSTHLALRYRASRQRTAASNVQAADIDYLYAASHQFGAEHAPLALMAGKLETDVSAQFASVQQPVLMIWGAQALNKLRALTDQHELSTHTKIELIKDAGVAIHEEYPASVVSNVLEWFAPSSGEEIGEKAETSVPGAPETGTVPQPLSGEAIAAKAEPVEAVEETAQPVEQAAQTKIEAREQEQRPVPTVEVYCVKCKKKTPMQDVEEVKTKNGKPAIRGKCSICGTGQFRMGRLVP